MARLGNRPKGPEGTVARGGTQAGGAESARSLLLDGQVVAYALRRSRRRSIGLSIDQRGLRVGAPLGAPLAEVEGVIRQHQAWVLNKLEAWQQRAAAEPPPLVLADGMKLPVLGQEAELWLQPGRRGVHWIPRGLGGGWLLQLGHGRQPRAGELDRALERALRQRALDHFAPRLAEYCARLGVAVPPLALSAARTRWGSCSRQSGIRLNWRLLHFPPTLGDYVVAHEVAHLREMNHSPRFWQVVAALYPDHLQARAELRRLASALPRWTEPTLR